MQPTGQVEREQYTRERCFIIELVNRSDRPQASLAHCRVAPGVLTERHRLGVDEWYTIIAGSGRMHIDDRPPFDVGPGDTVEIPAGSAQQVRNTGTDDLRFHCLCMPRFTPDTYEPLECNT